MKQLPRGHRIELGLLATSIILLRTWQNLSPDQDAV